MSLTEKQIQKLDKYISEINNDQTLKHKIEKINLVLTNQSAELNALPLTSLNNNESIFNTLKLEIDEGQLNKNEHLQQVNYDLTEMLLIDLRKYIASSVVHWNTKMTEFFKKSKTDDVIVFGISFS